MRAGQHLHVCDPFGEQVADITAICMSDAGEMFSSGRTMDYNETIRITTGHRLYSNRSRVMFTIVSDDVGVHDLLLTPCSAEMFLLLRGQAGHPSCLNNIAEALAPYGVTSDDVGGTLNAFMRVDVRDGGRLEIGAPLSKAGDELVLRAEFDLIVAITACSSEASNNGSCKPIDVILQ